ncbi:glycoside hydrolase family 16 protein [Arthrobacter sp. MDT1-65]
MAHRDSDFRERFDGGTLDEDVWLPAYLPAWSSRAESAATFELDEGLVLSIPPHQALWCPDLHREPLRVSAVQSANWSGPVGSAYGQQAFRSGLVVREEQEPLWGYLPRYGRIEVTCRADLTRRAMFSAWLVGLEGEPEDCGEICIVEVFGDTVETLPDGSRSAAVGQGVKALDDPRLRQDFSAPPTPIDVARKHTYAVDWHQDTIRFSVDGTPTRTVRQSIAYPMQLILGVFDFPGKPAPAHASAATPRLQVREVVGSDVVP